MSFNCILCDYKTDNKANYNKHLNTQKHKDNTLKCQFCKKNFNKSEYVKKHEELCKKKPNSNDNKINDILYEKEKMILKMMEEMNKKDEIIIKLINKLNDNKINDNKLIDIIKDKDNKLIDIIKDKDDKLIDIIKDKDELIKSENDYKKTLINNSGILLNNAISTTMSAINYIKKQYSNAPILELQDGSKLLEDTNDSDFCDIILHEYDSDKLHKYIGDIIIKHYKKDKPEEQSLWNTDKTRLNYIIRTLIDKKEEWIEDVEAKTLKQKIINPIIDMIKEKMDIYMDECNKITYQLSMEYNKYNEMAKIDRNYISMRNSIESKRDVYLNKVRICSLLLQQKNLEELSLKIIKHITPDFHLKK